MKLRSTGKSSHFFGACEVCNAPVSEVWMLRQTAARDYTFGHETCLKQLPDKAAPAGVAEVVLPPAVSGEDSRHSLT
jgi:hypothetical protein